MESGPKQRILFYKGWRDFHFIHILIIYPCGLALKVVETEKGMRKRRTMQKIYKKNKKQKSNEQMHSQDEKRREKKKKLSAICNGRDLAPSMYADYEQKDRQMRRNVIFFFFSLFEFSLQAFRKFWLVIFLKKGFMLLTLRNDLLSRFFFIPVQLVSFIKIFPQSIIFRKYILQFHISLIF